MNPVFLGPLLDAGAAIINRLIPDPEKKAAAELELLKMTQDGELKPVLAQLEINAKEAAHPSIFVAGWRPAAGWVCVFGLLYDAVLHNILEWTALIKGWPSPPDVNSEALIYILCSLLGIGVLRTAEKIKKVTK